MYDLHRGHGKIYTYRKQGKITYIHSGKGQLQYTHTEDRIKSMHTEDKIR